MEENDKKQERRTAGKPVSRYTPDIVWDMDGFPMNAKYPPNKEKYGTSYDGYPDVNREVLFYDFAVQGYDLQFTYKGKIYYAVSSVDHVALCDDHFTEEYEIFPHANAFIENFKIDGQPLMDLIDELEDVEPI